jgi:hypothetical protein
MPVNSLIDLFVPTLDAHDASVTVAMAGLDSGVLAFSEPSALEAFESSGPTPMHGGLELEVEGTTLLVLLPTCKMADYAPLLELGGLEEVMEAVQRGNGCAIVAGGHMVGDDVSATPLPALPGRAGRLVHMVWRSMLARDLSFEDAALTGLRLLGGTGPQGSLEDIGRYGTLLPVDPHDRSALISALNGGLGVGVERALNVQASEGQEPKQKRRRRSRRRGPKEPDAGAGGDEPTEHVEAQD